MTFHESNNQALLSLMTGEKTVARNLRYLITTKGYVNTNTYMFFVMQAQLDGHNNASGVCLQFFFHFLCILLFT
ncbi:hypothetical protein WN48_11274 [Eufriesea mexicana]|uniref:Uncharacterized protein n=1 Tax=Eufriesea mexicana TaxID=516756 RepID=A0A310SBV4_9HYME|nr:hypothetical protein WN48_11274 [Eufriesea mexicana]